MKQTVLRLSTGVFGAAAVIALVTLLARVVGFLRTVVLGQTLGADCLGSAYTTANAVPNVVFELVAGGALAGAVVPLIAGAAARGDRQLVTDTVRALTGWVLLLLVPAAVLVALLAAPIISLMTGSTPGCSGSQVHNVATSMLIVFSIQIPIYGLTVVAQGTLQAHHRFIAPALAPLVSSVVVIIAYGIYWGISGSGRGSISSLTSVELAILAWGTTCGVLAMWMTQWPGLSAQRILMIRPQLRFPRGVGVRARGLALAGAATVSGQWLAFALSFRIANDRGVAGAALVYTLAWTVFLLPWAILGLPVATSAFPRFSALYEAGEEGGFATLSASTTRAVFVAGGLGVAGVIASSRPVANLMLLGAPGLDQTAALAQALVSFAPGVLGFAVAGHVSRMFYARHRGRLAAILVVSGWLLGISAGWFASLAVASDEVVTALGFGVSLGMLVAGLAAIVTMRFVVGATTTAGLARTALGTTVAAALAAVAGLSLAARMSVSSPVMAGISALVVSMVVVLVFAASISVIDRDALSALVSRIRTSRGSPDRTADA